MAFTLDAAKALVRATEPDEGRLERILPIKELVDDLTGIGFKVLGVYGARARVGKRDGIICLPMYGRLVEVKPIGGEWYTPREERVAQPYTDL